MVEVGYKLSAETYGPKELIRQAIRAEAAGFDFVEISDHFHPWLNSQAHSPFAWSVLGAVAASTERIHLATGVTCPTVRYHPAIIAQAAATVALISDGRFTLGVGSGERLNEHIVGPGFPATVSERHSRLREAVEIIRLLWSGDYHSYEGRYFQIADARIFDLPSDSPHIAIAAGGAQAAKLAGELGDALFATEPKAAVVHAYRNEGGTGPKYAEVPVSWAADEGDAVRAAHEKWRLALMGWKVMSELPNPVNFEAASTTVREEDIRRNFACGTDLEHFVSAAKTFAHAGFDHIVLQNFGADPDGFLDFCSGGLVDRVRALPGQ
ncbi:TIGR03557 family F420-dependent LLM class oxidoreductase [Streptomyces sp. 8L]|uniref:TIGR03557 family F420-dependent LLM class oxidoreductase n=1 Tax=Streptomyces sp. 8L TaxID=2877242 RepID=UPI001CD5F4A0|nr:TIGR03557 family F420-dependent LLM class oxidoreductase [Streptomyces sp. 8L]MCA1224235.1 TIGR03557 family F420-dependent LLM class oxidoreductase [Streptomyces sp. 8L]